MKFFSLDRRGFGMAELLAVLLFVAVFLSVAVPRLWNVGVVMRLDGEAARLAAKIMEYRETVMTRQHFHSDFLDVASESEPRFDLDRNRYEIWQSSELLYFHDLPAGMELFPMWEDGKDPVKSNGDVHFSRSGNATPMTIKLQSGNEVRYVIVDLVGRVRVSPIPPTD